MRSTPRPDRADRRARKLVACTLAATLCAACSSHHPGSAARTDGLVHSDHWSPPAVSGPPGTASFCTLLVAIYQHLARLPYAADEKVKRQMIHDYVSLEPTLVAAAPPEIAHAARTYLGSVAHLLAGLASSGLDPAKLPAGELGQFLLDPSVKSAGSQVVEFSQNQCHYTIGG